MFNWESFVNGEFCVFLKDREQLLNFLKECEKKKIVWIDNIEATEYLPKTPCCIDCDFGDGKMTYYKATTWNAEANCINDNENYQTYLYRELIEQLSEENKNAKERIKKIEKLITKDEAILKFLKKLTEDEDELD